MKLKKNEKNILKFLAEKNIFRTADEISEKLKISTATIYRTVKLLNNSFSYDKLIFSEKGRGFKLNYDIYLTINNYGKDKNEKLPIERRNELLLKLLFKSPIKIKQEILFKDCYLGEASINKDISIMKQELKEHGITFFKKDGYIWIEGNEKAIRKLTGKIINNLNFINIDKAYNSEDKRDFDIDFVLRQMEYIEQELNINISYPYNINIFSHIYILINRFRKGKIQTDFELKKIKEENYPNKLVLSISKKVINRLSGYLNTQFPEIEVEYLYQYLISSSIYEENSENEVTETETIKIIKFFIKEMGKNSRLQFNSKELEKDLLSHFKPMLQRLKNGIDIKNDLLHEIKTEYKVIYNYTLEVSKKISAEFNLSFISQEEAAFITLYFVKNLKEINTEKNVIIICSSGIGTSKLLKAKVKKTLPDINVVAVLSYRNYLKNKEKYSDIDFILTTVKLKQEINVPYLMVSAIFTENDKDRVIKMIKEIDYENRK